MKNKGLLIGAGVLGVVGYLYLKNQGDNQQSFGGGGGGSLILPVRNPSENVSPITSVISSPNDSTSTLSTTKKESTVSGGGISTASGAGAVYYDSSGKILGVEDPVSMVSRLPTAAEIKSNSASFGSAGAFSQNTTSQIPTTKKESTVQKISSQATGGGSLFSALARFF